MNLKISFHKNRINLDILEIRKVYSQWIVINNINI